MDTNNAKFKRLDNASNTVVQFFLSITGIVLPSFALLLLGYEILMIGYYVYAPPIFILEPKHIFHALILSTTSVAFMGMHRAVHKLIPRNQNKKIQGNDENHDLKRGDTAFFFTLIANAILLAGLIIVYEKYFPNKNSSDDKVYQAPCSNEKLHANKH